MGFYLRKSITVGPLRFNLSKSGVGVSAGIKGFRVGMGPRGNYVHMGRGGIYYRKTLSPIADNKTRHSKSEPLPYKSQEADNATHAPLEEIESTTVFAMTDSDSSELLNELNAKRKKWRIWPVALTVGLVLTWLSAWHLIGIIVTAIVTLAAYYYDQMRKTVVLFYELEGDIEPLYEALHHAIDEMASCKKVWHIEAQGRVYDKKYHAGADNLIERKTTFIAKRQAPFVKTNILTPAIGAGRQTLFFFPDRLLVFENNAVGAVSYRDLDFNIYSSNFIEQDGVPSDANIVGRTWKYVNKGGGPDRRFSDNPEIPIAEYGYIELSSKTGLNERISLSKTDKGDHFQRAVKALAKVCA